MDEGEIGHGIIFERGDGADPEVWTAIGNVLIPDLPDMTRDAVEVTHTQSPNRFREFIGGLRDGGEVAPTLALLPGDASYAALVADYKSDEPVNYRVVLPNPEETAWTFRGLLTSLEHDTPLDDTNTVVPTFKVSGEPELDDLSV